MRVFSTITYSNHPVGHHKFTFYCIKEFLNIIIFSSWEEDLGMDDARYFGNVPDFHDPEA